LNKKPFEGKTRNILFDIIDDRNAKKSTIITSQIPVKDWYDCFSDPNLADAVMDRIVNGSFRIEMQGESMRKNIKKVE